ncbi:MotA/TolQ/ExbB proton channel family protein [Opitutia bacterium ISCC 51]|nr:MotA/TolQ/ExbB proton channel family protein [Opitutae bacterium ISCC 51]QXD27853.1 MotA/TolQ/ExbB proton channel family protein [Opitutae bacterium ISCC 52]
MFVLGVTFDEISAVWFSGGWVMIPLVFLAFIIFFSAMELILFFMRGNHNKITEATYETWIDDPEQGHGHVGEVISYVKEEGQGDPDEIRNRFLEISSASLPVVDARLMFLNILVTVSPLMGLLGTVIGMLATFKGLASGSGKTIDLVAEGISEALITTQTGLIIAIPGYLLVSMIQKKRNQYSAFLVRLESLMLQKTQKTTNGSLTPSTQEA